MKTKIRILHIDDNIYDRKLVKDALMKENDEFEVLEADNREKFEKYMLQEDFDLVLSDFNILGFDGLQVLQFVKEKKPDIPVIMVTGTGSEEVAIKSMKMGAADYVIKTVQHILGLVPTIKTVLEHVRLQKEKEHAQWALIESEELFRTAYENAAVGLCMLDLEGKFVNVNSTLCHMLGYSNKEFGRLTFAQITHPEDIDAGTLQHDRLLKGEIKSTIFEKRFIHKHGQIVWTSVSSTLVYKQQSTPQFFVSYILDISGRKGAEEQLVYAKEKAEESDRLKTAFLQNISLEIRTPVNAIVGFSSLLSDENLLPDERKNYTDIIIGSSKQLLSVINDIITIASIEAGQEKLIEKKINLNYVLKQIYEQFYAFAEKKNILFSFKTDTTLNNAYVFTDEKKLSVILTNLLNNAFKFTSKGFVEFGYTLKENMLEFYVSDSGLGIPCEKHEEIFMRFKQVEYIPIREHGGFGLGLSISKAYVELLGGSIRLTSVMDKGSVFYFTIPAKKTAH